jgi:hypothetical protein
MFLALTIEVLLILETERRIPGVTWLAPLAILVYHFVSLRRVFGGSRWATAWKGALLWIVYLFVIVITIVGVGLTSLKGTGPDKPQSEVTAH